MRAEQQEALDKIEQAAVESDAQLLFEGIAQGFSAVASLILNNENNEEGKE